MSFINQELKLILNNDQAFHVLHALYDYQDKYAPSEPPKNACVSALWYIEEIRALIVPVIEVLENEN